jgi:lysophospholipase L1-like esterase
MDTIYRPRTYYLLVDQFKNYSNSTEDVIFLGNSITTYTNWNELLELPQARNRGISGDTTYGILERLDEVIEGKPAKVFILVGINDISRNVPSKLILKNCEKIISRIKSGSPETEIYFQTILPVNNTFTRYKNHYNKDDIIQSVNEGLKIIAEREKITLINLHPHFLDKENRLDKKYTEEGLHLNAEGYNLWAKILLPYLN